MKHSDTS